MRLPLTSINLRNEKNMFASVKNWSPFRTYTQYGAVVQAFNKIGSGPMCDEIRQYTAEGSPEQPPHDSSCTTLTSQTLRVSWISPPLLTANGIIKGYKVVYGPADVWYGKQIIVII